MSAETPNNSTATNLSDADPSIRTPMSIETIIDELVQAAMLLGMTTVDAMTTRARVVSEWRFILMDRVDTLRRDLDAARVVIEETRR